MDITKLLDLSIKQGASDLHLSAGLPPMLRVDGEILRLELPVLDTQCVKKLIFSILSEQQRQDYQKQLEIDVSFELREFGRFRVNLYHQHRGMAAVFRLIPSHIPTLKQINSPPVIVDIINNTNGLVLVTGATGSGKSTTLAAMLNYINTHRQAHILTIEDPIEFIHQSQCSLVTQRELQSHTHDFSMALRSALREDPDVILVGELRDIETIRLALTAAETGHLVLSTLHTISAAKTVDRLIDVFPSEEKTMVRTMLAESLQAVIAQALLKKKHGGRTAAYEVMIGTTAIRNLIRENKIAQINSMIQTGQSQGMQTMQQCQDKLIGDQLISTEDYPINHLSVDN